MALCNHRSTDTRPGTLVLHLTGQCNLRCQHCYVSSEPSCRARLALDAPLSAIAECAALGIGRLDLTGGEPLLYRPIGSLFEAAARDSGLQTTLCTNGTLLTERIVELLGLSDTRVQVSIDGPQAFHDAFRQSEGCFDRSTRGILRLVEAGISTTVIMTVCRDNLEHLPFVADRVVELGVHRLRVQPLLRLGRARDLTDRTLSNEQGERLLLLMSDLAQRYGDQGLELALNARNKNQLLAHPCSAFVCNGRRCHRGVSKEIKKLVVRETGTVLPQVANLSPRFALGNLHEERLSTMVTRYMQEGYADFDQLCRETYAQELPNWPSQLVPWDRLIAERSHAGDDLV